jgi:hypothetical protein
MKLRIWCDSGANAHSKRVEIIDITELAITADEWAKMSDDDKEAAAKEVAFQQLDWGYEEIG